MSTIKNKMTGSLIPDTASTLLTVLDTINTQDVIVNSRSDIINRILQRGEPDEMMIDVKMLLFARWITTNYGTPQYDVNGYDGEWWKTTLKHFNETVYPSMMENGSVDNTKEFLKNNKT